MKVSSVLTTGALIAAVMFGVHAAGAARTQAAKAGVATGPSSIGAAMPRAERHQLIRQIAYKWSGYVKQVRKVDPVVWGRSMGAAFASADPANLRRAATMETYEGMIGTLLGYRTTDAKVIDALAMSSSVATMQSLASPGTDLVYTVITPCRILDTREQGGRLGANSVRGFDASRPGGDFTSQGGAATDCGIPADPSAVVMNVTVVQPDGPGYVTLFPYNVAQPLTSSVNNVMGADVGNETVVKLTVGDAYDFSAYAYAGTDIVADAVGYFAPPVAAALDCLTANGTQSQVSPGANFELSAACPAGYSVFGGGVRSPGGNANLTTSESYPQGGDTWRVSGKNTSLISDTLQARANCCRVPGR